MPYNSVKKYSLHIFLFILTLFSTTIAGVDWIYPRPESWTFTYENVLSFYTIARLKFALLFSVPFLTVLTFHEFGHYFTAQYYRIRVSLPYYIPIWFGGLNTIGTMGAFIRIKDRIFSKKEYFDVGIAGPLAGFVIALLLLYYGFTHLPPTEYIFKIHPDYEKYGADYANEVYKNNPYLLALGNNLLFSFFEKYIAPDPTLVPNHYEIFHYPFLIAGYLSLFFTALNLLPIGQLDGGHILYGLIGFRRFNRLTPIFFTLFIGYAGIGILSPEPFAEAYWVYPLYVLYMLYVFQKILPNKKHAIGLAALVMAIQFGFAVIFPGFMGFPGWLVFGLILARFLGIYHPPAPDEQPLSLGRKILGCIALLIFILCFSPAPFVNG